MADYNYAAARRAGVTDDAIIEHLAPLRPNYRLQEALDAGVPKSEIAQALSRGGPLSRTPGNAIEASVGSAGRGANTAIANFLGTIGTAMEPVEQKFEEYGVPEWMMPFIMPLGAAGSTSGADLRGALNALGEAVGSGPMTYESIEDLPQEQRPFARGGEVIGETIPLALAPIMGPVAATTQRASSAAGQLFQNMLQTARQAPGAFATGEAGATAGAATAAGLAEAVAPGNEGLGTAAEIAGATLSPVSLLSNLGGRVGRAALRFTNSKDARAASYLQDLFTKSGEDPAGVIAAIQQNRELKLPGTVGQQTNSPTVLALENHLARQSGDYARGRGADALEAAKLLDETIAGLSSTGNPADLTEAARLRGKAFDIFAEETLKRAESTASAALENLASGVDPMAMSKKAHGALREALDSSNDMLQAAWAKVPTVPAVARGFLEKVRGIESRLLPEQNLPSDIQGRIDAYRERPLTDTNELTNLRSTLLSYARRARTGSHPEYGDANIYEELAAGVLKDLEHVSVPGSKEARDLTRRFHETFTNTFANLGLRQPTAGGGDAIHPEALLDQAFGTGGIPNQVQIDQLRAAAAFPTNGGNQSAVLERELGNYARSRAIQGGVNPGTNEVDIDAMTNIANQPVMRKLPRVQESLLTSVRRQQDLERVRARPARASEAVGKRTPLGQMLRGAHPVEAVTTALKRGRDSYGRLANLASRSGPEATVALRDATIESIGIKAGIGEGKADAFGLMHKRLNTPAARGEKSLMETMIARGIMTQDHADRLNYVLQRGQTLSAASSDKSLMDQVVAPPNAISDYLTRLAGARMGGVLGGGGLVETGLGVRTARNIMQRAPRVTITKELMALTKDPELFAAALQRMPDRTAVHQQMNAALIQAGLDPIFEDEDE